MCPLRTVSCVLLGPGRNRRLARGSPKEHATGITHNGLDCVRVINFKSYGAKSGPLSDENGTFGIDLKCVNDRGNRTKETTG